MGLISAKGEFPRSIVPATVGHMINGIVQPGVSLPGYPAGQDGAQLYVLWGPAVAGQSQNVRDAQIIAWASQGGFRRLDTTAVANVSRDANGVLIGLDVSFEIQDTDGTHTAKLLAEYSSGDAMPFQIIAATSAD